VRLALANFVERDVTPAAEADLGVHDGAAVPHEMNAA
jgi:hypothetical protein